MARMKQLIIIALFVLIWHIPSYAQLDSIIEQCNKLIEYPYISDGQHYQALVLNGETAEFYFTMYADAVYRIAACTGNGSTAPIFRVYDKDRHLLFSNENYNYTRYWDFKFTSTVEIIVEAELPPDGPQSGIIMLMLGFK